MCTAVRYSLAEAPQTPPPIPPTLMGTYTRALLFSQERRHLFVTPRCEGKGTFTVNPWNRGWEIKRKVDVMHITLEGLVWYISSAPYRPPASRSPVAGRRPPRRWWRDRPASSGQTRSADPVRRPLLRSCVNTMKVYMFGYKII
jgi:hypothetical protein